ncbi:MAG: hypothetical protein MJ252_22895 [archaeon]|nr:hypothetical protein [archaeon]
MDPYGAATLSAAYQKLDAEGEKKHDTNDEIINRFYQFIREFKLGDVFKYR